MTHETLDLTLCTPAYNAAWCLPRLLKRARGLGFAHVLVYDDASTDDTAKVAESFGARVFRGERNMGNAVGKDTLLREVRTEWVHFLDADDYHYPTFGRKAREWIGRSDAPDAVLFNFEARDNETGKVLGARNFDDAKLSTDPLAYVLTEQTNHFGMYRTARVLEAGGFDTDPEVLPCEDWAFPTRLAGAGLTFRAEPEVCACSSQVEGSMSRRDRGKHARARLRIMQKAIDAYPSHRLVIAYELWTIAGQAATFHDWNTAETATRLAVTLGAKIPGPDSGSEMFRTVARYAPFGAVRLREWSVRTRKRLSQHYGSHQGAR